MLARVFFFQAEDGIRVLVRSRGLGDVYKRQDPARTRIGGSVIKAQWKSETRRKHRNGTGSRAWACLLYTSDAADERSSGDLGGRRIIKKKIQVQPTR